MNDHPTEIWTSAAGCLRIDLDALASNYRTLQKRLNGVPCGACVKADAYGLGLDRVAPVLAAAGCEDFFVSFLAGGIRLRAILPNARIHVFTGLAGGTPVNFSDHNLIPALNSLGDMALWSKHCTQNETAFPCDIQVDTGMLRLGLPPQELAALADDPARTNGLNIDLVFSHLACADTPAHELNAQQRNDFTRARAILPMGRASLANSSGIFLGPDFHYDLARPGVALYGANPTPAMSSPMAQVIRLQGRIMQVRHVDTPQSVGYGSSHKVEKPGKIATVGVGYADGYLRAIGNSGTATAYIGDTAIPVVGRVSMDMITLDISDAPEHLCHPGMAVDLIGPHHDVDDLARQAGTIGYEILTSLGARYHRDYLSALPQTEKKPA